MKVIYIRLPDELRETIKDDADKRRMTVNAYCSLVLRAHRKIMQEIDKTVGGKNG
jgi:hypothetical protein